MELNKEEFEKLNKYMNLKGFSLHSRSDYKFFDYCSDVLPIYYDVTLEDNYSFSFTYVTPKWHSLNSGKASPLFKEDHFDRLLNMFSREVLILENSRN